MLRYLDKNAGFLFSSRSLRELIEDRSQAIRSEIEQVESNRLLNTSTSDLENYFHEKFVLMAPSLRLDDWTVLGHETKIDVSRDPNRYVSDSSRPFYIAGQRIEIEVPIDGEVELMYARPSTHSLNPPKGKIRSQSLMLEYVVANDAGDGNIRTQVDRAVEEINKHIEWVAKEVGAFNGEIKQTIEQGIEDRKRRILTNHGRVASLGIPLKSNPNAPQTYVTPNVRRKVVPSLPKASTLPYEPEPILENQQYEHILSVVQNMTKVMERSPSAFKVMGEEDLRQHFLVQLNGQFEGAATAETFNVNGKTDILLRAGDRNVFIAECKFWKGPKQYLETIDQLIGYKAWRDTKTAMLIFNRNTSMSTVLNGVAATTSEHKNFKRTVDWTHESGFRYVFHHDGDANREFVLTVLVFDIPA
jgi:hypothetical protein